MSRPKRTNVFNLKFFRYMATATNLGPSRPDAAEMREYSRMVHQTVAARARQQGGAGLPGVPMLRLVHGSESESNGEGR